MKLNDALSQIQGPVGFSSLIGGLKTGDTDNLKRESPVEASLQQARDHLAKVEHAQANAKSDFAYWGYQGEVSAWRAAVDILEAAEITGPDNLPDIPFKQNGVVVMDQCANLERWGKRVIDEAKRKPLPSTP